MESLKQKIERFDIPTLAEHASISGAYDRVHPQAFSSEEIKRLLRAYKDEIGLEVLDSYLDAYLYGLAGRRKDSPKQHIFMELIEILAKHEAQETQEGENQS